MSGHKSIYWELFVSFFRIGGFTFGGGWAMISLIEKEVVEQRKWLTKEEFLDNLAVAQALPGILAVNISVAVGDKLRGMRGSICAATGTIILPFIIILAIAIFLTPDLIKNNETLSAIFKGIRPAVTALIIAPVLTSAKSAGITWKNVWIPVIPALLIWLRVPWLSNPILFIVLGGVFGYLYFTRLQLKGGKKSEAEAGKSGEDGLKNSDNYKRI